MQVMKILGALLIVLGSTTSIAQAQFPIKTVDLRNLPPTQENGLLKVYGAVGNGAFGVPVTGGYDLDGDGFNDLGVGYFTAPSLTGVENAGQANIILGNGIIGGSVNLASNTGNFITFRGSQRNECTASEVWIRDITGDGLGDFIICRQNYTPAPGREGAGAVTIYPGNPNFRTLAESRTVLELTGFDARLPRIDILGVARFDRLGIWARAADVDGDGIDDLIIGADQDDERGSNAGEVWVMRGGPHLLPDAPISLIDLAAFPSQIYTTLPDPSTIPDAPTTGTVQSKVLARTCRIIPPLNSFRFHLGGTLFGADMDGNGRAEVLMSATIQRAGASIRHPQGTSTDYQAGSGATDGTVFIAWDNNFPTGNWPTGFTLDLGDLPGDGTSINGDGPTAPRNVHRNFGEELAAGIDFDGDGTTELFVGDLVGDYSPNRNRSVSGAGIVFYNAPLLRNVTADLDNPATLPPGMRTTEIIGPIPNAIGSDTIGIGDFNGDGLGDIAIGNPHDAPFGRTVAGSIHTFYGRVGGWPAVVDTAVGALPNVNEMQISLLQGGFGTNNQLEDAGDTLCYSADFCDFDGDGITDLIANEMQGNGISPNTIDVGNLLVLSGRLFSIVVETVPTEDRWIFK